MGKEKIPHFNLAEGVDEAIRLAKLLDASFESPKIIAVAGPTSSGKTTQVTDKLIAALSINFNAEQKTEGFIVNQLQQDQFLTGRRPWDHPKNMDFELQVKLFQVCKAGKSGWKSNYIYENGGQRTGYSIFCPGQIVILDGFLALHPKIEQFADLKIYVDCKSYIMLMRRLLRDCGPEGRTKQSHKEVLRIFLEEVLPLSRKYVEPTRKNADLIIVNNFSPEELNRLDKLEIELRSV
ncbi:hypothetical protein HYW46_00280 [Candidatus Daviesbacteria bacterium]|nr:hypothetical protein [Candidatus Daviesbacteria bacterium]